VESSYLAEFLESRKVRPTEGDANADGRKRGIEEWFAMRRVVSTARTVRASRGRHTTPQSARPRTTRRDGDASAPPPPTYLLLLDLGTAESVVRYRAGLTSVGGPTGPVLSRFCLRRPLPVGLRRKVL
jgi:hypothetical protein